MNATDGQNSECSSNHNLKFVHQLRGEAGDPAASTSEPQGCRSERAIAIGARLECIEFNSREFHLRSEIICPKLTTLANANLKFSSAAFSASTKKPAVVSSGTKTL